MKYKKVVINGRFLAKGITGIERFAGEVIKELDKLAERHQVELVIPRYAASELELKNIKTVRHGNIKSHFWEQTNLLAYILKNRAVGIHLCNTVPLLSPHIVCVHDISYKVNPGYNRTVRGILSSCWHKVHYWFSCKFSKRMLTVSEYSKKLINEIYRVKLSDITVVGCGWQHFEPILPDDSIYDKWPLLKEAPFFFSLGSVAVNKNFKWILESAKNNPGKIFCITGKMDKDNPGVAFSEKDSPNLLYLGRLSDSHVKTLMRDCKAFIFPSLFEGFGLPPLEAMSAGAKIIISNAACLPEIYEDAAIYIDPHDPNVNLDELLEQNTGDPQRILDKFSWEKTAKSIWNEILNVIGSK